MTKLIDAIKNDDLLSVETLIKEGVDVNEPMGGWYPLHYAAGHAEICRVLLKAGANMEAQDISGDTALHYAAGWRNVEVCKELIKAGADVNALNYKGKTPLAETKEMYCPKIIELLKQHGAKE